MSAISRRGWGCPVFYRTEWISCFGVEIFTESELVVAFFIVSGPDILGEEVLVVPPLGQRKHQFCGRFFN